MVELCELYTVKWIALLHQHTASAQSWLSVEGGANNEELKGSRHLHVTLHFTVIYFITSEYSYNIKCWQRLKDKNIILRLI